jgi:hypothetical protein
MTGWGAGRADAEHLAATRPVNPEPLEQTPQIDRCDETEQFRAEVPHTADLRNVLGHFDDHEQGMGQLQNPKNTQKRSTEGRPAPKLDAYGYYLRPRRGDRPPRDRGEDPPAVDIVAPNAAAAKLAEVALKTRCRRPTPIPLPLAAPGLVGREAPTAFALQRKRHRDRDGRPSSTPVPHATGASAHPPGRGRPSSDRHGAVPQGVVGAAGTPPDAQGSHRRGNSRLERMVARFDSDHRGRWA